MEKIAIVTDSNSGITQEEAEKLGVFVIPMPFMIDDKEYFEGINLSVEQFFELLKGDRTITTSQPAMNYITELWDKLLEEYDENLTRLLIEKGRRRIVMIGAPETDIAAGLNRRRGAEQALLDAGLNASAMPYVVSSFEAKGGKEAMEYLLKSYPDLDGVVCATDTMAMGAISALREAGKDIPGDVSIVGVGDNWVDTVSVPGLTTAHLFFRQCGEEAAGLLLDILGIHTVENEAILCAFHLRAVRGGLHLGAIHSDSFCAMPQTEASLQIHKVFYIVLLQHAFHFFNHGIAAFQMAGAADTYFYRNH